MERGLKPAATLLILLLFVQTSCISRRRPIPEGQRPLPAQSIGRADLFQRLEERSKQIHSLQATVALDASGGAMKTGEVTEYRQTKGFILVDRPNNIRIRAQAPLALATVFDMVSGEHQYRAWIPIKNKFIIGDANSVGKDKNPVLNLRPKHIVNALFVDIEPYLKNSEIRSMFEEVTEGRRSFYVFSFINVGSQDAELIEKLWVDRTNLQVTRKQIFGKDGKVDTDVEYSGYQFQGEIAYPQVILIRRPIDDYMLKITFQRTTLNEKLAADAFDLERPAGSELVQLEPDGSAKKNPFLRHHE